MQVTAQQKKELEEFRAATRERALTHYDKVKAAEIEEKGKGSVVRPLLAKDQSIDKVREWCPPPAGVLSSRV
jgi:hypothetical protein